MSQIQTIPAEWRDPQVSPGEGFTWSHVHGRWLEPGASPRSGLVPPPAHRFTSESARASAKKGAVLTALAKEALATREGEARAIVDAWLERAKSGEGRALETLLERVDGKVDQGVTEVELREFLARLAHALLDALPGEPGRKAVRVLDEVIDRYGRGGAREVKAEPEA